MLLFKSIIKWSYAEEVKQSGCVREELDLEVKRFKVLEW
jgi:hypothetical protein